MFYRLLVMAAVVVAVVLGAFAIENIIRPGDLGTSFPSHWTSHAIALVDGARGKKYPITLIIETPKNIHAEAIRRGMIEKGAKKDGQDIRVVGFATYSKDLTFCMIWVPPLSLTTVWVWIHEILHCNTGPFHDEGGTYHGPPAPVTEGHLGV